jgi:murein DD-endopeptidase MepM/ murein hydrolase activator NlpD
VIRGYSSSNEGLDIAAPQGTTVRAAAQGTVAAITENTDQISILVLRHENGLLTVYANVQDITVARGDTVTQGQSVARVAAGDPSYLHFEVRRGFEAQDPNDFLPR